VHDISHPLLFAYLSGIRPSPVPADRHRVRRARVTASPIARLAALLGAGARRLTAAAAS
jgi:hypothetical protein